MTLDINQVEQLNAKAQRLNSERQRLLGMKESARLSYDKAVHLYKERYGVALDDTNLQAEYNSVSQKMEADYQALLQTVNAIESGEYKQQHHQPAQLQIDPNAVPAAPQQAQPTQPSAPVQSPVQPEVQQTAPAVTATQQIDPALLAQATSIAQQQQPTNTQPAWANFETTPETPLDNNFGQAQQGTSPAPSSVAVMNPQNQQVDVSEESFTPAGWGAPKQDINANFQAITSGDGGFKFGGSN